MSEINDGGPAFPFLAGQATSSGMSLRDWFAGQALDGLLSATGPLPKVDPIGNTVRASYAMADAMLLARTKPTGEPK